LPYTQTTVIERTPDAVRPRHRHRLTLLAPVPALPLIDWCCDVGVFSPCSHNPVHPGDFLKTEIIQAHGLSVTAAAKVLGVSRPALSNLLNQNADLSGEMALRIEKAFGVNMDTLMRMQAAYDIAQARKRAGKIRVRRYRPDSANA
jgi:antitoxin HigA-1